MAEGEMIVDGRAGLPNGVTGVVGLGASAGGLHALQQFFAAVPSDLGLAYVVVQHLSPNFKSLMVELLSRHTDMALHRVEDGMVVMPNAVYLIPPKAVMTITPQGVLQLSAYERDENNQLPIDAFFESLANSFAEKSAALVLSGTGRDGSKGVMAINAVGGLVMVQSEETAEFSGMPQQAIATRVAQQVLPPTRMPAVLRKWCLNEDLEGSSSSARRPVDPVRRILLSLLKKTGIDFGSYKLATIHRRMVRRQHALELGSIEEYAQYITQNEDEIEDLRADLLIGVTSFFRDEDAFAALGNELQRSLQEAIQQERGAYRVWVAGCSTGEEVYSVAMVIDQALRDAGIPMAVRIFATDIDPQAIEQASRGFFDDQALESVSEEQLRRYFVQTPEGGWRICQHLREQVVFAQHNILNDPPFLDIDLITCRNLLIYFDAAVQSCVMSFFHYALKMGGLLFLGASEGLGNQSDYFENVDGRWKIYKKAMSGPVPMRPASLLSNIGSGSPVTTRAVSTQDGFVTNRRSRRLLHDYDRILERCGVSGMLIDEARRPLHIFGDAHRFLRMRSGRFDDDVLNLVDDDLRISLTTSLQKVIKTRAPASVYGVSLHDGENHVTVDLDVELLDNQDDGTHHFLIQFRHERPSANTPDDTEGQSHSSVFEERYSRISELEHELKLTKESLQATVEELQTSNEELQSANEELQAANEELQSSNEELHSVNEELHSVNSEYESKNRELLELNQDHDRLLSSLDIGTVFLDQHGRIRKFNPAIQDFFKLLTQDIGRPLEHIAYALGGRENLLADVRRATEQGEMIEREIPVSERVWSWMRIMPFFNAANEMDGVVLTFTNVSQLKQAELDAASARDRAEAANAARLRFLATVSHELRTPLNGMIGALELLEETEVNPDQQELLRTADGCGRHLDVLIEDVLDYASIEQGIAGIQLHNTCFDLHEAVDSAITMVTDQAYSKGLALDCSFDPAMPCCVHIDRTRLMQVCGNLLSNAVKYTNVGHVRVSVTLTGRDHWEFRVADSGIGISEEDKEKIFIPFQQLPHDFSEKLSGVGLGLSICQHLVQRMDGELRVESIVGVGSTFVVRLPIYADPDVKETCVDCRSNVPLQDYEALRLMVAGPLPAYVGLEEVAQSFRVPLYQYDTLAELETSLTDVDATTSVIVVVDLSLVEGDWNELTASLSQRSENIYCLIPQGAQSECLGRSIHKFITRPIRRHLVERVFKAHLEQGASVGKLEVARVNEVAEHVSILVVEDNPVNQQLLRRQLESLSYDVDVCSNGKESLSKIEERPYDLVLMDLMMPIMDGYAATTAIRGSEHPYGATPIVALTASCYPDDLERCREVGFTDIMNKPVRKNDLAKMVRHIVHAHRSSGDGE